jgi:hypothetical protein
MARSRANAPIEPMDLANMRENGARSLWVQCNQCRHTSTISQAISPCSHSGRAWCARSAGRSARTPGQIGKSADDRPGSPPLPLPAQKLRARA